MNNSGASEAMEISIKDLFRLVRKWLLPVLAASLLVTLAAAFYYYRCTTDYYTATAKLYILLDYVDSNGEVKYDISTSAQFAGDFKELILTPEVVSAAEAQLGYSLGSELGRIDVVSVTNTRVINVEVTDEDPAKCMTVANVLSEVFVERVKQLTQMEGIQLASRAVLPGSPSGPPRARNCALAFLVSMFLGFGLVVAIELLDTRIRSEQEIEDMLKLGVLAKIPDYRKQLGDRQKDGHRVPMFAAVSDQTKENIRTLWANLQYASMGKELRTFAIMSTTPDEGKTTLLIMLARVARDEGKRVLLVDLDLRNPTLGRYLGVRGKYDLFDYLSGSAPLSKTIVPTSIENVHMIDSQRRNRMMSVLVNSESFANFMASMKEAYDVILFDVPPIGMFVDAAIVASKLDGVALVLASGKVEVKNAEDVVEQLKLVNANIVGAVLNYVPANKSHGYYYYYHYGSRRRSGDKKRG